MKLSYAVAALTLGLATAVPANNKRQPTTTSTVTASASSSGLYTIETHSASSAAPIAFSSSASAPYYLSSSASGSFNIPYVTGTGYYPSGTGLPVPTGTASGSSPISTGDATCPVNGALLCNGPQQFGLCNWGRVVWQPVAAGTCCVDGVIDFCR